MLPRVDRRTFLRRSAQVAGTAAAARGVGGVLLGTAAAEVRIPPPRVLARADWGADESIRRRSRSFASVRKIVVHHTATANDEPDPRRRIRSIYRYHVQRNGWNDIGYHFLVDRRGRIYEGRFARSYDEGETPTGARRDGDGIIGAHALNHNAGSVGIALLGTFTGAAPTRDAVDSLVDLVTWLCSFHDIPPTGRSRFTNAEGVTRRFDNVCGHLDVGSTSCPGALHDVLPRVRRRAAQRIEGGIIGYRVLHDDSSITPVGSVPRTRQPWRLTDGRVTAVDAPRNRDGFWAVTRNGAVFVLGKDLPHHGDARRKSHTGVVDLMVGRRDKGYALLASNGRVMPFGEFEFHGSATKRRVGRVGRAVAGLRHPDDGYYVATDAGAVYGLGVPFHGSMAGRSHAGIVHAALHRSGDGYWLLGADGAVYAFGRSRHFGNAPGGAARILPSLSGEGYVVLGRDGSMFAFGDAPYLGNASGKVAVDVHRVVRR